MRVIRLLATGATLALAATLTATRRPASTAVRRWPEPRTSAAATRSP